MRVTGREDRLEGAQPGGAEHFSGATLQRLLHEHPGVRVLMVSFEPGAHTNWHRHRGGQVLHVMEGECLVQSWGEEVRRVAPGELVTVAAEEKHWHGAGPDQRTTHLAVSVGQVEWLEPV